MDINLLKNLKLGNIGYGLFDRSFDSFNKIFQSYYNEPSNQDFKNSDNLEYFLPEMKSPISYFTNQNPERYFFEPVNNNINNVFETQSFTSGFLPQLNNLYKTNSNIYQSSYPKSAGNEEEYSVNNSFSDNKTSFESYSKRFYDTTNIISDENNSFNSQSSFKYQYQNTYSSLKELFDNQSNEFVENVINSAKITGSNDVYKNFNSNKNVSNSNTFFEERDFANNLNTNSYSNTFDSKEYINFAPTINVQTNDENLREDIMQILNLQKTEFMKLIQPISQRREARYYD